MARRLAHEIKNPLTPIQLSAEHLQRKLSGSVSVENQAMLDRYTHTIVQQVEAMKSMVNAFTEYARSPQPLAQRVNINAILEEIALLYHQDNAEVTISLKLDKSIPDIDVDDVRLRQLVHNLVKNSLETVDGKGWIRLRTASVIKSKRRWIEFSVEDSGNGVAEEVAQNLFEPYVTTKSSGSGLGLAIVKKIVDEHGGSVRVERAPQGGAKFSVLLPLADVSRVNAASEGDAGEAVDAVTQGEANAESDANADIETKQSGVMR
jgi:nitrogen fixation/metabolism regulation signal transduction histidine kinase